MEEEEEEGLTFPRLLNIADIKVSWRHACVFVAAGAVLLLLLLDFVVLRRRRGIRRRSAHFSGRRGRPLQPVSVTPGPLRKPAWAVSQPHALHVKGTLFSLSLLILLAPLPLRAPLFLLLLFSFSLFFCLFLSFSVVLPCHVRHYPTENRVTPNVSYDLQYKFDLNQITIFGMRDDTRTAAQF